MILLKAPRRITGKCATQNSNDLLQLFANFIENTVTNIINVAHGKVEYNPIKYATAYLYSDWLYFHSIKDIIIHQIFSLAPNWSKLGNIWAHSLIFKTARIAKNIWRIINTIASIWGSVICPWTLSVPHSSQYDSSYTFGKLFASWNRLSPQTNILAYFHAKSRLLFTYNQITPCPGDCEIPKHSLFGL